MIRYQIRDFKKSSMCLQISADYVIQFENENEEEIYSMSLPKTWIDILQSKFPNQEYDVYKIFFKSLKKEIVNRITDYKKIWGLMKLNQGIKEDFCETTSHKIYFGIDKVNLLDFSYGDQVIICKPKNTILDIDRTLLSVKAHYNGDVASLQAMAEEIIKNETDAFLITWNVDDYINLTIHGAVENRFSCHDFEI